MQAEREEVKRSGLQEGFRESQRSLFGLARDDVSEWWSRGA
jgi:hypothetical protein